MKKQDYLLAGIILLVSLALNICISAYAKHPTDNGAYAAVYVDGELFERIDLNDTGEHEIKTPYGVNVIGVYSGRVAVTDSDCKSHDCIKMGKISHSNEYICCLPHRLYIVIEDGDELYDTVTY